MTNFNTNRAGYPRHLTWDICSSSGLADGAGFGTYGRAVMNSSLNVKNSASVATL